MKRIDQNAWYADMFVGLIAIVVLFFANIHYDMYIHPDTMPSGKGGKALLLIMKKLDLIGGKLLVLGVLCLIALWAFVSAIKKYRKK